MVGRLVCVRKEAEAPLTYWRSLCAAFVLNVVASLMTLLLVFLIMIPVALSLALADRAGLVALEPAFRSILPFAQVCGLIFGGLPWSVRLFVRRGIKSLRLRFLILEEKEAKKSPGGNLLGIFSSDPTPSPRPTARLIYVESLKVAWTYMWPNFIAVAVMATIAGETFQVSLPLLIFLQPFWFRRAFNKSYSDFTLCPQRTITRPESSKRKRPNPAITSVMGWAAAITGITACAIVVVSTTDWAAGPFASDRERILIEGIFIGGISAVLGLIWAKRKGKEEKSTA